MRNINKTRREFLRDAGRLGLAVALMGGAAGTPTACQFVPTFAKPSSTQSGPVRLGIWAGTQTLWRYLAQRKDELFKPLGYDVMFENLPSEDELRDQFLSRHIDVIATLPTQLPLLLERGAAVQFFAPISWMKEGYPLVVPSGSSVNSLPDLQGRAVAAFPLNTPGLAYWRALVIANYGFKFEEKVRLVESLEPETLLASGQVDAAIIASPAWAALRSQGTYRLVSDLNGEWQKASRSPNLLMYGGFAAHKEWIQQNQRFVEDCIRVVYDALLQYRKDKKAILEAATSYGGENVPALTLEANTMIAAYLGLDDAPPERAYLSQSDVQDHKRLFALLAKAGYLKSEPQRVDEMFYISAKRPK